MTRVTEAVLAEDAVIVGHPAIRVRRLAAVGAAARAIDWERAGECVRAAVGVATAAPAGLSPRPSSSAVPTVASRREGGVHMQEPSDAGIAEVPTPG